MIISKVKTLGVAWICLLCFLSTSAFANKSSVEVEAPEKAAKGEEIRIKVHVSHDGNSFMHHTDWVYIKVNGEEVKRWEYSMFGKPPSEAFTEEITFTVNERLEIEAKAHCNLHGSKNTARSTVYVEPE